MAVKKRKMLAGKLRSESDAQASWGGKIHAPKVYDEPTAYPQGAAWKSAKAAGKHTVATRARYETAMKKKRRGK